VSGISRVEGLLAEVANFLGALIMHDRRSRQPETGVMMLGVVPGEELLAKAPGVVQRTEARRSGNSGRYFSVLNWLSENGLSSETCGRLCVLVTPRSASGKATGLDFIDEP